MWTYNCALSSDELYHWGIKGQKWGVRRYQNKDGTLTPAGKKRYDDDSGDISEPKKSKHRLNLEAKFKKAGLSDEEAAKQADKRIRTEKILVAVGATTVAATAAYVVHKHLKEKSDGLIKAGDSLQRIEMTGDGKLHDVFYAANEKSDKIKYAGQLGQTRVNQVGKAYLMDIGVQSDIKVAGRGKSLDVFRKLYDSDADFRKAIDSTANTNAHGGNAAAGNIKKLYDNFNSRIVMSPNKDQATTKFLDTLKSEGYGAIKDVNDMKFSGYNAKNPLIVFGQSSNVAVKTMKEMSKSEIDKNVAKDGTREVARLLTQSVATYVPIITLASAATPMSDEQAKEIAKTVNKSTGRK